MKIWRKIGEGKKVGVEWCSIRRKPRASAPPHNEKAEKTGEDIEGVYKSLSKGGIIQLEKIARRGKGTSECPENSGFEAKPSGTAGIS